MNIKLNNMEPSKKSDDREKQAIAVRPQIKEIKATASAATGDVAKEIITRLPHHCTQLLFLS